MSENRKSKEKKDPDEKLLALQRFHLDKRQLNKEATHRPKDASEIKYLNNEIAVGLSYRYLTRRSGDTHPPLSGKSGIYLPGGSKTAPELVHSTLPAALLLPPPKYPIPTVNLNDMISSESELVFKSREMGSDCLPRRASPSNISTNQYRNQIKRKYHQSKKSRIQSSQMTRRKANI